MTRWRGLKDLLVDAVHHGVTAVEGVHRRTMRATVEVIALAPGMAGPARTVGAVQDAACAATYETIRLVNGLVGAAADIAFDAVERAALERGSAPTAAITPSSSAAPRAP